MAAFDPQSIGSLDYHTTHAIATILCMGDEEAAQSIADELTATTGRADVDDVVAALARYADAEALADLAAAAPSSIREERGEGDDVWSDEDSSSDVDADADADADADDSDEGEDENDVTRVLMGVLEDLDSEAVGSLDAALTLKVLNIFCTDSGHAAFLAESLTEEMGRARLAELTVTVAPLVTPSALDELKELVNQRAYVDLDLRGVLDLLDADQDNELEYADVLALTSIICGGDDESATELARVMTQDAGSIEVDKLHGMIQPIMDPETLDALSREVQDRVRKKKRLERLLSLYDSEGKGAFNADELHELGSHAHMSESSVYDLVASHASGVDEGGFPTISTEDVVRVLLPLVDGESLDAMEAFLES